MGLVLFFAGLGLLIAGSELTVRGSTRVALSMGVRPMVIGLTVVAVGTSTPELAVGITAVREGTGGLAVGNIAGTNMFNLLFILGLSALLLPLQLHLRTLRLELPVMVAAAALAAVLSWDGVLSRTDGGVMFACALAYTVVLIRVSRGESRAVKEEFKEALPADGRKGTVRAGLFDLALLTAGLALLVLGADWLVSGSVRLARLLGLSETMIGLTIVAMGTSAPEFVTTVVSTIKGERDVAVGNLLGSSIYNILVILGLTCLASPGGVEVERRLVLFDVPLMVGVAFACIPVFVSGRRISRLEGGTAVALYVAYMTTLIVFQ